MENEERNEPEKFNMLASDRSQLASSKSEKVSNLLMKFVTMFRSMSWESTFVILVFSWVMPVSYTHLDVYKRQDSIIKACDYFNLKT